MSDPILRDELREHPDQEAVRESMIEALKGAKNEGPGQYLRQMRETLGISKDDVASELNVHLKHVTALEEDDYDRFPAPVYVRNHLRRYADIVGLPQETVIAAYERIGEGEPPPLKRVSFRQQVNSTHSYVRWITYLFAVALIVLFFVWWRAAGFEQLMEPEPAPPTGSEQGLQLPGSSPADDNESTP